MNLKKSLYLVSALILLAGLGSSVLICLFADDDPAEIIAYEDSKMYMHDLELYGGKVNVLMNEFMRWFGGLWHGKSLAFTVAFLSVLLSFVLLFIARRMRSD